MKISTKALSNAIKSNLNDLEDHLPARIRTVLETLVNEDLKRTEEMKVFDVLVYLIFQSDKEPATSIANLMVPLDAETVHQLDEWTISTSAAFLRDHLQKDYVHYILKSKAEEAAVVAK